PAKSHAPLGAPMPRAGQNLREAGAPNRTAAVRTWQRHGGTSAGGPPGPPAGATSERGHAGALGTSTAHGTGGAAAAQPTIAPADPRQEPPPLPKRQGLPSHHRPDYEGP